jgi:hypothetical protein
MLRVGCSVIDRPYGRAYVPLWAGCYGVTTPIPSATQPCGAQSPSSVPTPWIVAYAPVPSNTSHNPRTLLFAPEIIVWYVDSVVKVPLPSVHVYSAVDTESSHLPGSSSMASTEYLNLPSVHMTPASTAPPVCSNFPSTVFDHSVMIRSSVVSTGSVMVVTGALVVLVVVLDVVVSAAAEVVDAPAPSSPPHAAAARAREDKRSARRNVRGIGCPSSWAAHPTSRTFGPPITGNMGGSEGEHMCRYGRLYVATRLRASAAIEPSIDSCYAARVSSFTARSGPTV